MLKQPKVNGGLRLVDLTAKYYSSIAQWVLTKNEALLHHLCENCLCPKDFNIWLCNTHFKDSMDVICGDTWWSGVHQAWCRINFHEPHSYSAVLNQVLWFNSHVKIAGKMCCNKQLIERGVLTISDLMMDDLIMNVNQLVDRFPEMSWLEWYSLMNAIPKKWKNIILNKVNVSLQHSMLYSEVVNRKKVTALLFRKQTYNCCALFDVLNSWNKVLATPITMEEFEDAFKIFPKITISAKLHDFQLRLLHKRLPTNRELMKWKIKHSDKCHFCDETDSITHLIFYCDKVKALWETLKDWILTNQYALASEIELSMNTILTNRVHPKPGNIINLFVLVFKQLIY